MNLLLIILSGLVCALSLPTSLGSWVLPDLSFLAWVGLIPLALVLRDASPRLSFRMGMFWGMAYYGLSLYWIFIAMHHYGEVPWWGSLLGIILAVLIESFFIAACAFLVALIQQRSRTRNAFWLMITLVWVLQDFVRCYVPFGGFSWSSLGYSQRSWLGLIQILDVTGIYGVTALIVLANAVQSEVIVWLLGRRGRPWLACVSLLLALSLSLLYGHWRWFDIRQTTGKLDKLRVSIVQGNIPQDEKWVEEMVDDIINRHVELTQEAEKSKPDLIVWPEAAFPAAIPPDWDRVASLAKLKTPLLMGVVTYEGQIPEEWPPDPGNVSFKLHNSAMVVEAEGKINGRYDKNHLVPMGEYVPLQKVLFFLNTIVPSISSFTPGVRPDLMEASRGDQSPVRFGTTICYEDLFPAISRTFVRGGADFLVNLTNDAWYETSSAMYQHFDFSRYRAIESRRAMVRATNTGITGFFSPTGEVIAQSPIFKEHILTAEIPLGGPLSFYTRHGDVFAWGCVAIFVLLGVTRWRKETSVRH